MSATVRMMKLPQVLEATGVGKTKLYAMIAEGEFPPARKFGRASRWPEYEVVKWQRENYEIEAPAEPNDVREVDIDELI